MPFPVEGEIEEPHHRRQDKADASGDGRPFDAQVCWHNEDIVKDDVGHAAQQCGGQAQTRSSCGGEEKLEHHLQYGKGDKEA